MLVFSQFEKYEVQDLVIILKRSKSNDIFIKILPDLGKLIISTLPPPPPQKNGDKKLLEVKNILGSKQFGVKKIWGQNLFRVNNFGGLNFLGSKILRVKYFMRSTNCWGQKLLEVQTNVWGQST